jgi:hypothetical protein
MSERASRKLSEFAGAIRSSNAAGTFLTFDIMFDNPAAFEQLLAWNGLTAASIAALYLIKADDVQVFWYRPALTIKITIPRPILAGEPADTDIDGKQQHAPLLDIAVPDWVVGGEQSPDGEMELSCD